MITLDHVSVSFGGLRAVDDVSFRAESGIVEVSSRTEVRELGVPELEREVIVSMPDRRARPR